ncbi:carboxypeptidase-like regulatory domain-containing protein [Mucilaginibacter terrae]|uniref:Carboxypeptidase-like regulatory domain-containing protein n=1 Tax=Mucilaginibacter terrae TaxID=1955052 RepID=A0ABU3GNH7_9SPHI|nr:carboxypeptidase-like regulatory domain-containing protein [Mucilaginibacter terrae]MDT3401340.1 hypothetical protein [Mucilaginibacter terrae]
MKKPVIRRQTSHRPNVNRSFNPLNILTKMYALLRTKKFSFTFLFLIASAVVYGQTGTIKGTVTTSDGKPAEFVSIGLNGTTKGTTVNQKGTYQLNHVAAGAYTLTAKFVGLTTQSKVVEVKPNEITIADFMLSENLEQLQEVVISGTKNNKFAAKKSDYVARLTPGKPGESTGVYGCSQGTFERADRGGL